MGKLELGKFRTSRRLSRGWLGVKVLNEGLNYLAHLERRRDVCGGERVVKGTRETVRTLLAGLSEGAGREEILAGFPTISVEAE